MIETFPPRLIQQSNREGVLVLASSRAHLECGCSGYVGDLLSTRKEVTVLRACSPRHDELIGVVHGALVERLKTPLGQQPLVQLVDALLREADALVRSAD